MVGNPARQVGRRRDTTEAAPRFEPYGVNEEMPDPVARALNGLLGEVSSLRARLEEAERALVASDDRAKGRGVMDEPAPPKRERLA